MCECSECCSAEEFEEEELTQEEVVSLSLEMIEDGECLKCTLDTIFEYAYSLGKRDLARESRDFYQDVLDEEE